MKKSAVNSKLLWYKDVISPNSVIMVGWILNGDDLKVSCTSKAKDNTTATCKVWSKVPLHDEKPDGTPFVHPVTRSVQFEIDKVNEIVSGDITMLQ